MIVKCRSEYRLPYAICTNADEVWECAAITIFFFSFVISVHQVKQNALLLSLI